jgi:cell division protein FtsB
VFYCKAKKQSKRKQSKNKVFFCVAKMQCYLFDLCVFYFIKNNKNKAIALQKSIFASGKQMKKVKDHTQDKQKQVKLIKKACSKLITPLWT